PTDAALGRDWPRLAAGDILRVAARGMFGLGAAHEDALSVGKPPRRAVFPYVAALQTSRLSRARGVEHEPVGRGGHDRQSPPAVRLEIAGPSFSQTTYRRTYCTTKIE